MRNLMRSPVLAGMAMMACCAALTGAAHPGAFGAPTTTEWPAPWGEEEPADPWTEAESEVVRLVNEERSGSGCGTLTTHETLTEAAREHSRAMAGDGGGGPWSFGHDSASDRAREHGYDRPAGEIVASGFETAEEAVHAWTNRGGHHGVLANCATEDIGVGVVRDGGDGPYWTVILGYGS